jgi:hypothetical protein
MTAVLVAALAMVFSRRKCISVPVRTAIMIVTVIASAACRLTPFGLSCSILDIQKVLDGEIEVEAMDSHNNWCLFFCMSRSTQHTSHVAIPTACHMPQASRGAREMMRRRWQATATRSPADPSLVLLHFVGWDESRDEVRSAIFTSVIIVVVVVVIMVMVIVITIASGIIICIVAIITFVIIVVFIIFTNTRLSLSLKQLIASA